MIPRLRRMFPRAAWFGLALVAGSLPAAAQELGVIPTRIIYPGETVAADALAMAKVRKGKPTATLFAHAPKELIGKVAKRTLLPGRYIPVAAIRDAWLVEQGAAVQVYFIAGDLTISATAVSLQPGAAGDLIKVRNTDSGKIFSGTVMADGTIRVSAS
jgi:flagellar basal body P-ring formation protein FlgA